MVELEMEVARLPAYRTDLKDPNFAKLAKAIGIMGQGSKSQPMCPPF